MQHQQGNKAYKREQHDKEPIFRRETLFHDDGSGNNDISTMAYIPKFKSSGWPQSVHNGLELGGLLVGRL